MMGELVRRFLVSKARGLGSGLCGLVDSGRYRREHYYNLPLFRNRIPSSATARPENFEIL